ncbi:MAG: tetratricopeptide repeat protein [Magnetococcus sp. DMHC-6]
MKSNRYKTNLLDELGLMLHTSGQVAKKISSHAVRGFNELFAITPQRRRSYYLRKGIHYAQKGHYSQAVLLLEEILMVSPDHVNALFYLGFCYLRLEYIRAGIQILERVQSLEGCTPRLASILGLAYIQEQQFDKAIALLEQGIVLYPNNFNLNYRLGVALSNIHHYEAALVPFQKAIAIRAHDPRVYRSLGFALEQLGRSAEALPYSRQADQLESGK